jgi:hypothetical protein
MRCRKRFECPGVIFLGDVPECYEDVPPPAKAYEGTLKQLKELRENLEAMSQEDFIALIDANPLTPEIIEQYAELEREL